MTIHLKSGFPRPFKAGAENSSDKGHLNYKEKINWDHMSGKKLKLGFSFREKYKMSLLSQYLGNTTKKKQCIFLKNRSSVMN